MLTPFLVFLGALMVNFGDAASWKIKSHSNAHYEATQTQSFRSRPNYDPNRNPRPSSWRAPATFSNRDGSSISQLDNQYWNQELQEYSVALMGDPLQDPYPQVDGWSKDVPPPQSGNVTYVDRQMFADEGAHIGTARIRKRFPIAAILNQSEFNVNHSMELLSGDWNFWDIGPSSNRDRRVDELYDVEPDELPQVDSLLQRLTQGPEAGLASYANDSKLKGLASAPGVNPPFNEHAYDVLDNDFEYRYYYEIRNYNPRIPPPTNYHQHPTGRELEWTEYGILPANRGHIPSTDFERYLKQIHRVPRLLGRRWKTLYEAEIAVQKPDPGRNYPGAPPLLRGKHWTDLEKEVENLKQYLSNLQGLGY